MTWLLAQNIGSLQLSLSLPSSSSLSLLSHSLLLSLQSTSNFRKEEMLTNKLQGLFNGMLDYQILPLFRERIQNPAKHKMEFIAKTVNSSPYLAWFSTFLTWFVDLFLLMCKHFVGGKYGISLYYCTRWRAALWSVLWITICGWFGCTCLSLTVYKYLI